MKTTSLFLAMWLAFAMRAAAQLTTPSATPTATPTSWVDAWRASTVALGEVASGPIIFFPSYKPPPRYFLPTCTGILLGEVGPHPTWLLTAKHCLQGKAAIQVRFSWFEDRPEEFEGTKIDLVDQNGQLLWRELPPVDLAALPFRVASNVTGREMMPVIPFEVFAKPADLFLGAPVMTLGYPAEVGPPYWTTATVRHGTIASLSPANPLDSPFLIDCPTFPGNSGGPAFRVPGGFDRFGNFTIGGSADFLGVVVEGRKDYQPVLRLKTPAAGTHGQATSQTPEILLSQQWMNLGVVIPARRVLDLLRAAGVQTGVSN